MKKIAKICERAIDFLVFSIPYILTLLIAPIIVYLLILYSRTVIIFIDKLLK